MVFGQITSRRCTLRVGLHGCDDGEYFRDEQGKDVLFFVDTSSATQAGSEVSALPAACRAPWLTSRPWRPRWGAAGAHHDTKKGSITSVQAIYVPRRPVGPGAGDGVFAPRRDDVSERLDCRARIYPPSIRSPRRAASSTGDRRRGALRRGAHRAADSAALQGPPDIIAILGMDELSEDDKVTVFARAQDPALPVAAVLRRRGVHRHAGQVRETRGHVKAFQMIVKGELDELPEQAFYMRGGIERGARRGREDGGDRLMAHTFTLSVLTRSARCSKARWNTCRSRHRRLHGVLANHAALVSGLMPGTVTLRKADGVTEKFGVTAGSSR